MKNDDGNTQATVEDFNSISPERWAELDAMTAEYEAWSERVNLVPLNAGGEQYIRDRYPIAAVFDRAYLQEIAESESDTVLTETEIQDVAADVYDDFPHEMYETITNAIGRVVARRTQP